MCEVHNTEPNFAGSLLGRSHFCNKNRITYMQGSKCAVSRIPEEFNIHGGKSTNLLTFPNGKVSNSVNFPILVREIEISCLFPLVVIQNITESYKFQKFGLYWARPS